MHVGDPTPTVTDFKGSATDASGNQIEVTPDLSQADLNTPGSYPVTLTSKDGQTKQVTLTVLKTITKNNKNGNANKLLLKTNESNSEMLFLYGIFLLVSLMYIKLYRY